MDGLEGSEQGWVVNSRAGCRSHPTRPQRDGDDYLGFQIFIVQARRAARARLTPGPGTKISSGARMD